ncbi:MAG: hypothetical protein AB4057_23225 [Crocosphaera sp.]
MASSAQEASRLTAEVCHCNRLRFSGGFLLLICNIALSISKKNQYNEREKFYYQNYHFMESSSSSGKVTEPPAHRWTHVMGIAIAIVTLIVPILVIAYYSSSQANSSPANRVYLDNPKE